MKRAAFVAAALVAAVCLQAAHGSQFIGRGNPLPQAVHAFRPTAPPATVPYGSQEGEHWHYFAHGDDWVGVCETGAAQSPVNIASLAAGGLDDSLERESAAGNNTNTAPASTSHTHVAGGDICSVYAGTPEAAPLALDIHYNQVQNASMVHNGHALQVTADLGFVVSDGQKYQVRQFHFHTPSEHTFNADHEHSGHASMEMHIVHQRVGATGLDDLLVVAVLFDVNPDTHDASVAETQPNAFLNSVEWSLAPTEEGKLHILGGTVDLSMLEECVFAHDYYTLRGSLTTPPCSESVRWFVMGARQRMQQRQLEVIARLFPKKYDFAFGNGNNRATQPLNGRVITWYHHAVEPTGQCREKAVPGHPCLECSKHQGFKKHS